VVSFPQEFVGKTAKQVGETSKRDAPAARSPSTSSAGVGALSFHEGAIFANLKINRGSNEAVSW